MSTHKMETKNNSNMKRKFVLAGLAVVGIGAAISTAAWTDDVMFAAGADAATFDLQGSIDGSSWQDVANQDGVTPIDISGDTFANMKPGDERTSTVYLKNAGSVDVELSDANLTYNNVSDGTKGMFADINGASSPVKVSAAVNDQDMKLAAGEETTMTVSIKMEPSATNALIGKTGSMSVLVTASPETD